MASAVPKIGPTLREGAGGTAGALAGGLVVSRRQKKIVAKDTVKVSNNFGTMLRQGCYPSRKGSGSTPDSSPAVSKADIIPSDEEILDNETTPAAKPGGHPSGAQPAGKRDFAAAVARQKCSDDKVNNKDNKDKDDVDGEDNDDADDNDDDNEGCYVNITGFAAAPAAAAPDGARARAQQCMDPCVGRRNTARGAWAAMSPSKKVPSVPSRHTAQPGIEATADQPDLRFGMEALRDNMKLPGTAAYRFAATMGHFDEHDGWADDFGAFVAAIRNEDTALKLALSPGCEAQTYLCINRNSSCSVVLQGLRRWTANPSSPSVNSGRLVVWEGKMIKDGGPPDLWRLDNNVAQLFELFPFARVDLRKISHFYSNKDNDDFFFGVGNHSHQNGHWVSQLIPIQTGWAALFVDYPPLGVAFRRVMDLINSVAADKANNFRILAWQVACACFRTGSIKLSSLMALGWSHLARSNPNIQLSTQAWYDAEDEQDSNHRAIPGTRKDPPEQADDFKSLFGGGKRPKLNLGHWAPPIRASTWGGDTNSGRVPGPMRHLPQQHPRHELPQAHAGAHASDLASMLTAMVQAQTDGQIAVAAANTSNLIAFTTAMAQALATSAGSENGIQAYTGKKISSPGMHRGG
jgi:hypothetical protein